MINSSNEITRECNLVCMMMAMTLRQILYSMRDWREKGQKKRGHGVLGTSRMEKSRII
jgi:hypothetical protein